MQIECVYSAVRRVSLNMIQVYSAVRRASLNMIQVYSAVRRESLNMIKLTMYYNGETRCLLTSTSRKPRVGAGFTPNPTDCCYKV